MRTDVKVIGDSDRRSRYNSELADRVNKQFDSEKRKVDIESLNENKPELNGFIYVPTIGLYVSKKKELFDNNWFDATEKLHNKGDRLITPTEFTDFVSYLLNNKRSQYSHVLAEIIGAGGEERGEWLDTIFLYVDDKLSHGREYEFKNGIIKKKFIEDYKDISFKNGSYGLTSWLNKNSHGFPIRSQYSYGRLKYTSPEHLRVPVFLFSIFFFFSEYLHFQNNECLHILLLFQHLTILFFWDFLQ